MDERLGTIDDHLLSIIFSKLPLKSLLQFRSVSKLWLSLIDHPFFTNFHLSHQSSPEPCILSLTNSDPTNPRHKKIKRFRVVQGKKQTLKPSNDPISEVSFVHSSITLEGSCNGILCFLDSKKKSYFLLNPCCKEIIATLPHPGPIFPPQHHQAEQQEEEQNHHHVPAVIVSGFGYDSLSKKYKVVRIVYEELDSHVSRTKVFTLGTSSWREIDEIPPYPVHGKPIYAHGFLHWLVSPFADDHENLESLIVCFHVGEEKFSFTPHPSFESKHSTLFGLLELKGELGMVDLSMGTKIDIWVMKDYEKKRWVMEYQIEFYSTTGDVNYWGIKVIGLWEDGEILLQTDGGFFVYSQKTGLRYKQGLGLESDGFVLLHSHSWSLMSVNSIF